MTVTVGQVWQHKNSGARWTVTEDGEVWVGIVLDDGRDDGLRIRDVVRKTILVDDFILVKDAP